MKLPRAPRFILVLMLLAVVAGPNLRTSEVSGLAADEVCTSFVDCHGGHGLSAACAHGSCVHVLQATLGVGLLGAITVAGMLWHRPRPHRFAGRLAHLRLDRPPQVAA